MNDLIKSRKKGHQVRNTMQIDNKVALQVQVLPSHTSVKTLKTFDELKVSDILKHEVDITLIKLFD